MSDKSERWAFAQLAERDREIRRLRDQVRKLTRRCELWRQRALRKTVKR